MNRAERFSYGLNEPQRQAYRPDIDGLRAVSVLAVVAFHAFPSLVPGGFVGVDVFFVISGFLISGIIFDELRRDEFTLQKFYARRVRRIFPALIVVLAASAFAGIDIRKMKEESSMRGQLLRQKAQRGAGALD